MTHTPQQILALKSLPDAEYLKGLEALGVTVSEPSLPDRIAEKAIRFESGKVRTFDQSGSEVSDNGVDRLSLGRKWMSDWISVALAEQKPAPDLAKLKGRLIQKLCDEYGCCNAAQLLTLKGGLFRVVNGVFAEAEEQPAMPKNDADPLKPIKDLLGDGHRMHARRTVDSGCEICVRSDADCGKALYFYGPTVEAAIAKAVEGVRGGGK